MKSIDVFDKFYSVNKLSRDNIYYNQKIENFELMKYEFSNNISKLNSLPIRATIQTTEYCNLNCIMCQIHGAKNKRKLQKMNKQDFDKIVKFLFPHLIEVHPTNIGEALISPWFNYFTEKVIEFGVLMDLTTNGMLLTEEISRKILPNLLDIKISFDGIHKKTFENIRRNSDMQVILRNIDNLLNLKKNIENKGTVTLQMTLLKSNYKELLAIIELAASKGIDRVKAFHVFAYNNEIKKLSLIHNLQEFEEIRIKAIELSKKLNIALEISEPPINQFSQADLIYQKCRLLWAECWIDTNGDFYPCHSHNNNKYGNFINDSVQSVWNSNQIVNLRNYHSKNNQIGICNNCGMNYLKKDENQMVPYDISGFIGINNLDNNQIRWSSRSKQFLLKR